MPPARTRHANHLALCGRVARPVGVTQASYGHALHVGQRRLRHVRAICVTGAFTRGDHDFMHAIPAGAPHRGHSTSSARASCSVADSPQARAASAS
jgi:hypothetical protein